MRNIKISHHNTKSIFITLLPEKYHFKYQLTKIIFFFKLAVLLRKEFGKSCSYSFTHYVMFYISSGKKNTPNSCPHGVLGIEIQWCLTLLGNYIFATYPKFFWMNEEPTTRQNLMQQKGIKTWGKWTVSKNIHMLKEGERK